MNINDLVTRKSYNHDIVFQIKDIQGDTYILKGVNYRLFADSNKQDLVSYQKPITLELPDIRKDSSRLVSGKILHIDGDKVYMQKAEEAYRKYKVYAKCVYLDENLQPGSIISLLKQDKYDVLVLTGHDFIKIDNKQNKQDLTSYQNSFNFVVAVQLARTIYPDLDSLVIIAGACQSNYEALIANGANFASSPKRENIHLLDPIIIATIVATTPIKEYVSPEEAISQTISKSLGGIETKGKARRHFTGVNKNGHS